MQQPPDPYAQFQQPYNAPTSPYAPPPPYNYNPPPKRSSGIRHWFRTRSRNTKIGLGCGTLIAALLLCICAASAYGSSNIGTTSTPTPTPKATTAAISQAIPTDTPTIAPTDTLTPVPTQQSVQPTPTVDPNATMPRIPGLSAENGPELGRPMSAFTNTFGKPFDSSDPVSGFMWGINNNHITLSAAIQQSGANKVAIITIMPDASQTWSRDRQSMVAFCSEFLPYDAVEVNHTVDPLFDRTSFTSNYAGAFYMLVNQGEVSGTWACDMDTGN